MLRVCVCKCVLIIKQELVCLGCLCVYACVCVCVSACVGACV